MAKNSLIKNIFLLVSGTTFAQLISVLASPILTRLYTPEEYGMFALFTSISAIFAVVSSLTLEQSIPLPKSNNTASALFKLAITIVIFIALLVSILIVIIYIKDWFLLRSKLSIFILLIPAAVLSTGLLMINNFWAIRNDKYRTISNTKVIQVLTQVVGQILFSFYSGAGLILGYILGVIASSTFLIIMNKKLNNLVRVSKVRVYASLRRYRRFPIFSTWEVLFNAISLHSAPIIFALFFGSANAGLFALSFRIISLPVSVIGTAVGHGLYGKAEELKIVTVAAPLLEKIVINLIKLGLVPFLPIVLFGPEIFSFIFGSNWELAGVLAQYVAIWIVFQLVASPLSAIFPIYEQQVQGLIWQVLLVLLRLAALYIAYLAQDFMLAVILYSAVSAVSYFILLVWVSLLVKIPLSRLLTKVSIAVIKILAGFSPLIVLKLYIGVSPTLIIFLCSISGVILIALHVNELKSILSK